MICAFVGAHTQRAPDEWLSSPAWDWFGYDWDGEYYGNVFDEDGACRGRIAWLDYNNIVAISQAYLPAYNWHYNRLKGFGLGENWVGKLYRDDTPTDAISMRWKLIPQGEVAWFEVWYELEVENGPPVPVHLGGWLRKRW